MTNDRQITISAGASRRAVSWQAQTLLVSELYHRLQTPVRSTETLADYMTLKKPQQDDLKDVGGFVGGMLDGPRRKSGAVHSRDILALDLDSIPAGGTEDVLRRLGGLGCGYCVYSTRKHTSAAPRLRVLFPLDRPCTADEYEPLDRRMAEYVGLTLADPSTFEASRLMYWPSCCADGEYLFHWADKPMLSVEGLLATYTNWREVGSWPQVPGALQAPARLAARQGDPEAKPGVVGAFCRVYDVRTAIDTFLPGIYEGVDNDRYTFTGGSTTGGAVVYDSGKFLFSHHATDPCGGRLVNAFDLVRLHRFGDLDNAAHPDTPTNKLPSYTAMRELATGDGGVKADLLAQKWEDTIEVFGVGVEDGGDWRKQLTVNSQGTVEKSMRNLHVILGHDPRLEGHIRLNLFSGRVDVDGVLPWTRPGDTRNWSDEDTAHLRIFLEPLCGKCAKNDILDAVVACAGDQSYHPVRDYLNGLAWDGVPRLNTLLIDYLGAEDSDYTRTVTRKAFAAAVARVMRPGCKYDTMLVLIGGQGRHKSTILTMLGGEWFSSSLRTFDKKEAMETIQGTWINEVAEMQAMVKTEVDAVKAFITNQTDYFRASYGRFAADHPRQCVFFGTTNSKECLIDTTGGRRFWPVDIDQRHRKKNVFRDLPQERDQVWAEAVAYWKLGESLHLSPELETLARVVQEEHRQRHPWEGLISDFLAQEVPRDWSNWDLGQRQMFYSGGARYEGELAPRQRVCAVEIWCEVLGKPKGDMQQRNTRELNGLLEILPGWENLGVRQAGKPYNKQRCFGLKTATVVGNST